MELVAKLRSAIAVPVFIFVAVNGSETVTRHGDRRQRIEVVHWNKKWERGKH